MKILIITGKIAENSIRRVASSIQKDKQESDLTIDVFALPLSVASFITPEYAAKTLTTIQKNQYDIILLPGTVIGDVSPVEKTTGIPTFKGASTISELPLLIELLDKIKLSKTVSASEFIYNAKKECVLSEIEKIEQNWKEYSTRNKVMVIGGKGQEVPIGNQFPMRIIAEIVNAPSLDIETVKKRAVYYESEGADIIDIGMLAGKPKPEIVVELVEAIKDSVKLPISIDTLNSSEIKAAVSAGVDLVLSVDRGNIKEVAPFLSNTPVVVLPTNIQKGFLPFDAEERISFLKKNIELAKNHGIQKIIADLVLEPAIKPGISESLMAYYLFRKSDNETPLLFGLGNVTELIDIDSTGINGLLSAIACEVNANLLFVPESSIKAKGSVRETAIASKMMFLAKRHETPPKDLGIDLLKLKEKRWNEEPYNRKYEEKVKIIDAQEDSELIPDKKGCFKIQVDRDREKIIAIHYKQGEDTPDAIINGFNGREIYQTIIRRDLISKYDHAAYLGKELEKAEIALRLKKSYTQDVNLF